MNSLLFMVNTTNLSKREIGQNGGIYSETETSVIEYSSEVDIRIILDAKGREA